jgi:hypothetical protein
MSIEFDRLVDMFIESGELGHYDEESYSICLYDIKNDMRVITDIMRRVRVVTPRYTMIVLQPNDDITNINILDIGI